MKVLFVRIIYILRSVSIYSVLNCYFDDIFSETRVMVAVRLGYMSVIVGIRKSYAFYCVHISKSFLTFEIDICCLNFVVTNIVVRDRDIMCR